MISTTQNMLYHIGNLNEEQRRISFQMSSPTVLENGSDDSVLYSDIINLDDKIRVTEGLMLQMTKTSVINDTSDTNMASLKLSLDEIKEDLLKSLNTGMDRSDKLAVAVKLEGIRDNMYDFVNYRVDGEYLFTGSDTSVKTFTKDDDFNLNGQVEFNGDGFLRQVAVQPGSYRERGVSAYDVIFYNTDTSAVDDKISFTTRETVVDDSGHTWIPDTSDINDMKLVKLDYNGKETEEYLKIENVEYIPQEIQIHGTVASNDLFEMTLSDGVNDITYSYTAVTSDDGNSVSQQLLSQIQADITAGNAPVSNIFSDISKVSTDGDGNIMYDNDLGGMSTSLSVSNMITGSTDVIFALPEAKYTTETISSAFSNSSLTENTQSGLLLESKHNYFDDLNEIINALEGYSTLSLQNSEYTGEKDQIITDEEVREILSNGLEQTTNQFDATNIGHAKLGGRNAIFENAYTILSVQKTNYDILQVEIESPDVAKLSLELASLELTYQSLYSTIAKFNELSLVKYL